MAGPYNVMDSIGKFWTGKLLGLAGKFPGGYLHHVETTWRGKSFSSPIKCVFGPICATIYCTHSHVELMLVVVSGLKLQSMSIELFEIESNVLLAWVVVLEHLHEIFKYAKNPKFYLIVMFGMR